MRYNGGKNGAGVYQSLINLMPPHDCFIESFLGSGAVMRLKKPARQNFGIDLDESVISQFSKADKKRFTFLHGDALEILSLDIPPAILPIGDHQTLIYADPPYPLSVRLTKRPIYKNEMLSDEEHENLLSLLKSLSCMVMLSGYRGPLYDCELKTWRRFDYYTTNRGGRKIQESVWMNYDEPARLHDYRYLGATANQRQDFKRLQARQLARLERMPTIKRYALLAAIEEYKNRGRDR